MRFQSLLVLRAPFFSVVRGAPTASHATNTFSVFEQPLDSPCQTLNPHFVCSAIMLPALPAEGFQWIPLHHLHHPLNLHNALHPNPE